MFDLRDVATYIAKRVGLTPGRIWFGAGNAINAKITAQQRRNYRHELKRFLVFDDFHKRQPEGLIAENKHVNLASRDITSASQTCLGTCAKTNVDVFVVKVAAPGRG